jgi:AraC family transcriptional regulator, transcriptional activator of pobA
MNEVLPTDLLVEFDGYFKKGGGKILVNIDKSLKTQFDLQLQRFEDAVKVFGGSIPPNRFSHFYIALLTNGSGIKTVGLVEFNVVPNTLIFIPSGTIHSSHSFSPDTKGFILSFSTNYLLLNHSNKNFLNDLAFFQTQNQPFLYLTDIDGEMMLDIFKDITAEYLNYTENKDDLLRIYILELLLKAERIYKKQIIQVEHLIDNSTKYLRDFKQLLEKHFLLDKSVSFYALQLNTHPNHLNAMIKDATGKTCSEFIHERIILEAKCLLKSTDLSVKEIAAHLSFEDSSYFSKYFKKLTDISPIEYKTNPNL